MERNVVVASAASNQAKRVKTSATTWGELRGQSDVSSLISGDVEAIVNPGKLTLGRDESLLPEGDFSLYLIPRKNKAGVDYTELAAEIAQAIMKAASLAEQQEVDDLKGDLLDTIASHFDVDVSDISNGGSSSEGNLQNGELRGALDEARELQQG